MFTRGTFCCYPPRCAHYPQIHQGWNKLVYKRVSVVKHFRYYRRVVFLTAGGVWKTRDPWVIGVIYKKGKMVQQEVIWQSVLGELEVTLPPANFVTWFKNTQLLDQEDG